MQEAGKRVPTFPRWAPQERELSLWAKAPIPELPRGWPVDRREAGGSGEAGAPSSLWDPGFCPVLWAP